MAFRKIAYIRHYILADVVTGEVGMARTKLTAAKVRGFACPEGRGQAFLFDTDSKQLAVRVTPRGDPAYVFESRFAGSTVRVTIGSTASWPLAKARERARELQQGIDAGIDPRDQKRERLAAARAKREAAAEADTVSLAALLDAYIEFQKARGRSSWQDAQSIFRLHVVGAWPKVARLPARDVTGEMIGDAMRKLVQRGQARTANKLRAYLRSAFNLGRKARTSADIPVEFKAFGVTSNPADDCAVVEGGNNADKNPLTPNELRTYWHAIEILDGLRGAALRLHLLTGGQRIEQLVRLRTADIHEDHIVLFDSKGRPGRGARAHHVPLLPVAVDALRECAPRGEFALSSTGGSKPLDNNTLGRWARAAAPMIEGFTAKRIRSGVETALAAIGVSREVRGHLQSHGIAGIQARHYDAHDYLPAKRRALEELFDLLTADKEDQVVPIRARG